MNECLCRTLTKELLEAIKSDNLIEVICLLAQVHTSIQCVYMCVFIYIYIYIYSYHYVCIKSDNLIEVIRLLAQVNKYMYT